MAPNVNTGHGPEAKVVETQPGGGGGERVGFRKLVAVTSNIVRNLTFRNAVYINRQKFTQVTILGFVEDFEEKADFFQFKLKDEEGTILVRKFGAANEEVEHKATESSALPVVNGSLVRVFGNPRGSLKDKAGLHINAFKIVAATSLNELILHIAEVLAGMITLSKVKKNFLAGTPLFEGFPNASPAGPIGVQVEYVSATEAKKNETDYSAMVLKIIKEKNTEIGITIADLEKLLPDIEQTKIAVIVSALVEEGHIYTTIDDFHFLSVET